MSDTTAYLAGCATTGVAVLVLLVARAGMQPPRDRVSQLPEPRLESLTAVPTPPAPSVQTEDIDKLEEGLRDEISQQRDLTTRLVDQLDQQASLTQHLENQVRQQQDDIRSISSQLQTYQQSVEAVSRQQQVSDVSLRSGLQSSLLWVGAGLSVILVLGGGALILCLVILIIQSQRQQNHRSAAIYPSPMPPPAAAYRYYDAPPAFLPPPLPSHQPYGPSYDYDH